VNGREVFILGGLRFAVKKVVESNIRKIRSKVESGFSLLELMIAMFILVILLSVALPTYQRSVQHAKETVLKENLWQMRKAIDQYASDKGKYPQSLNDLVEGKYLREMPVDPMLEKAEWKEIMGEDPMDPDAGEVLKDVKSAAEGVDSNGNAYDSEAY
jgi:general secretion pathway protein G